MTTDIARQNIEQLIARTALRDRQAFDQLYRMTSAKLFGTCLRVLKNKADAEEAVQEVFVKIWLKADRYAVTNQSPMTWLIAIARHQSIDRLRARKETTSELDANALDVADDAPSPETSAVASGERRSLNVCLDQLEGSRADAVRSAYLDGQSYTDLAARHKVPLNTMRTWLRRSLMRLKECLQQ